MFGNFFGIDNNSLPEKKDIKNTAGENVIFDILQKSLLSASKKSTEKPAEDAPQLVTFSAPTAVGVFSFDISDVVRRHKRLSEEITRKTRENEKIR